MITAALPPLAATALLATAPQDVADGEATGAPTVITAEPAEGAEMTAFNALTDDEIFQRAADAIEAVDTLRASFTQYAPSGRVAKGTLSLDRPGRLRFDYDDPNPQTIVAVGGQVYVHDAALETTDTYPLRRTPLRFLLSRNLDREAAVVQYVSHGPGVVELMLTSSDGDVEGQLGLVFSTPELELAGWRVVEPSGATTTVQLAELERDVRMPGRLFRVPRTDGTFLQDR